MTYGGWSVTRLNWVSWHTHFFLPMSTLPPPSHTHTSSSFTYTHFLPHTLHNHVVSMHVISRYVSFLLYTMTQYVPQCHQYDHYLISFVISNELLQHKWRTMYFHISTVHTSITPYVTSFCWLPTLSCYIMFSVLTSVQMFHVWCTAADVPVTGSDLQWRTIYKANVCVKRNWLQGHCSVVNCEGHADR